MKGLKPLKNSHTPNTKFGMGDNYGTGVKQKIGRQIDSYVDIPYGKKTKTPPKSMA
jgi:hypothetical protein